MLGFPYSCCASIINSLQGKWLKSDNAQSVLRQFQSMGLLSPGVMRENMWRNIDKLILKSSCSSGNWERHSRVQLESGWAGKINGAHWQQVGWALTFTDLNKCRRNPSTLSLGFILGYMQVKIASWDNTDGPQNKFFPHSHWHLTKATRQSSQCQNTTLCL